MKLVKKAAKLDVAAKFRSMQANARVIKYYRSKVQKSIIESIKFTFEDAFAQHDNNPSSFLENSLWIYQDIMRIEEDVVPCFPPSYEIYNLYIREYHRALNGIITKIVQSAPEASILLQLHAWIKDYKKNMKELNVPPELLEPAILDGNEQILIEDYLKLIIKKLDEWTTNLMKTEIEAFTTRAEPPEVDSDGLYGTQGAVILFQMINQQVDLALDSGQGLILSRTVEEVNRVMRSVQDQWTKVVDAEYKKQVEKPDEVAGGLVEYCIALANDQLKCADFAETLSGRIEPLVSEKYGTIIHDRLNDAIDGCLDVAKKCTQSLIDIIFNDLKPATKQLFQPTWYDGIIVQIIETMRDYMSDYQTYLNSALFDLLVEDLLDSFLVTYITALANSPKLRIPAATERIKDDLAEAYKFFGTLKNSKDLQPRFEVLEMILSLLEASKSLVFLSYWSFAKVHGPNIAFVETLMKNRADLDRSGVNEVMESIKRKVKEEELTDRKLSYPSFHELLSFHVVFSARTYYHEEDCHPGYFLTIPHSDMNEHDCSMFNLCACTTTSESSVIVLILLHPCLHCISCIPSQSSNTSPHYESLHLLSSGHSAGLCHFIFGFRGMDSGPVWKGYGHLVNLLELPREPGGVEEGTHIKACARPVNHSPARSAGGKHDYDCRLGCIVPIC